MARGTESKNTVFKKVQDIFPAAFFEDEGKILRIPLEENGELVEIKMQLTAAKTNLGSNVAQSAFTVESPVVKTETSAKKEVEVTEEEKERVAKLIASLNL